MGGTATLITVAYAIVTAIAIALAVLLAWTTARRERRPIDPEKLAHRERNWLYAVIVIMLALLFATIGFTPYGQGSKSGDVVVDVEASQFFWQIKPKTVPAGKRVVFHLRSTDVNHGFGIYGPNNQFIAQAQVMPKRTQTLVHTFRKPGRYQILCLEFCGFGHALMQGQFTVTK